MPSALQNRHYKKDYDKDVTGTADVTVTNASDAEAILTLGTLVPANSTAICTAYEWAQVPADKRTQFELTAV